MQNWRIFPMKQRMRGQKRIPVPGKMQLQQLQQLSHK